MKTLKISAILFAGLLCANTMSAQKGAYANINLGYNFSLNSDVMGTNSTTTMEGTGGRTNQEIVKGSFGAGMNFGGTFGMMFSDNLGAELGFNYLMGSSYDMTENYTYTDGFTPANSYQEENKTTVSASMMQFNPSIVLSAGKTEGLNPYGKFGFVFGMGTITIEEDNSRTGSGARTEMSTQEYGEGMAFGWSAAFGATYNFSEKLGLFGEMNMINMSYAPTRGEYTAYTSDGVDVLADAPTYAKEVRFEDSIESDIGATTGGDEDQPREELKNNYSFSSLGLKIGLRFQF